MGQSEIMFVMLMALMGPHEEFHEMSHVFVMTTGFHPFSTVNTFHFQIQLHSVESGTAIKNKLLHPDRYTFKRWILHD